MVIQEDIRLDMASDPRLLGAVRALVRRYLRTAGVPADQVDGAVLAVDEACSNSIRHSYGGRTDQRIDLTLRMTDGHAEIVLCDQGVPADPGKCQRKDLESFDSESLRPGGLGVQFMHRVFDEVHFEPGPSRGNRVTMRLRWPSHPEEDGRRAQDA